MHKAQGTSHPLKSLKNKSDSSRPPRTGEYQNLNKNSLNFEYIKPLLIERELQ